MNTTPTQAGLFPEPEHAAPAEPEYRWHIYGDARDDDELGDDDPQPDICFDAGNDLRNLADGYADDCWLYDLLTDTWYEPHGWPADDAAPAIALHRVAVAAANPGSIPST